MSDTILMIMARYPEIGTVKTRLATELGDQATLTLYTAFLHDLARKLQHLTCDICWVYTPASHDFLSLITKFTGTPAQGFVQEGESFNDRLLHAFITAKKLGYTQMLVISSDIPHLSPETIELACQELAKMDLVIGPGDDGGYYLLGMHHDHDLFHGFPMSTNHVLAHTLTQAQTLGLSITMLPTLRDIDTLSDLHTLLPLLEQSPDIAPLTANCLSHLIQKERFS